MPSRPTPACCCLRLAVPHRYRDSNTQSTPGFCPPAMVVKTEAYLKQVTAGGENEEAATAIRE